MVTFLRDATIPISVTFLCDATRRDAHKLVFHLKSATDGHIPFFTSDELPHYADALLDAYGELKQPPRQGSRGPRPAPRKYPPPDLCYAVVVKERERGRVVNVTTRIVCGTDEQIRTALHNSPVSQTINTYGLKYRLIFRTLKNCALSR